MSSTVSGTPSPTRRVRHQARDAVALMAFSATMSLAITALAVLVARLGQ